MSRETSLCHGDAPRLGSCARSCWAVGHGEEGDLPGRLQVLKRVIKVQNPPQSTAGTAEIAGTSYPPPDLGWGFPVSLCLPPCSPLLSLVIRPEIPKSKFSRLQKPRAEVSPCQACLLSPPCLTPRISQFLWDSLRRLEGFGFLP